MNPAFIVWMGERLQEPSTWRGLIWLLAAFGIVIQPEWLSVCVASGAAIAGAIGILTKDAGRNGP